MKQLSYNNLLKVSSLPTPSSTLEGVVLELSTDKRLYYCDGTNWVSISEAGAVTVDYPVVNPSLVLDFANAKVLDPRITFTRASKASYYDSDGLLKLADSGKARFDHDPVTGESKGLLIEESRTNLLTYSENFDNAVWTKVDSTILPNITIAPDGSTTADKIIDSIVNTSHTIQYNFGARTAGDIATASIYVKKSEKNYVHLRCGRALSEGTVFDLNSGTVSSNGAQVLSSSIIPVGNGWYRLTTTVTILETNINQYIVLTILNSTVSPYNYIGDGMSGVYAWGAQVEVGSFPTSYIPSTDTFTSRASTATYIGSNGLIQSAAINTARYQYNPLNLGLAPKLLLEEARTNSLTYSEQFDNGAWGKARVTITANARTAPDNVLTADKLAEDSTATNNHYLYFISFSAHSAGAAITFSVFLKSGERTGCRIIGGESGSDFFGARFDLATGTVGTSWIGGTGTLISSAITSVGNGWFKCSVTGIVSAAATSSRPSIYLSSDNGTTISYTGNGASGIYIWGAQLEVGAYPTSYIPTTTTSLTRSADVSASAATTRSADLASMTGTNFSSWYNQSEGTILAKGDLNYITSGNSGLYRIDDTTENNRIMCRSGGSGSLDYRIISNNTSIVNLESGNTLIANTSFTHAAAYKLNDFVGSYNGNILTDSSGTPPNVTRLLIGDTSPSNSVFANGRISKLIYYPKRLTDTVLPALTK